MNQEGMLGTQLARYSRILKQSCFPPNLLQYSKSLFTSGHLSPNHSCLEDGSHVTGHCPDSPISQAPGSQSKGTPPKQAGEGGNSQSPHRPLLCDMEGNRRDRPEYGNKKGNFRESQAHSNICFLMGNLNV